MCRRLEISEQKSFVCISDLELTTNLRKPLRVLARPPFQSLAQLLGLPLLVSVAVNSVHFRIDTNYHKKVHCKGEEGQHLLYMRYLDRGHARPLVKCGRSATLSLFGALAHFSLVLLLAGDSEINPRPVFTTMSVC